MMNTRPDEFDFVGVHPKQFRYKPRWCTPTKYEMAQMPRDISIERRNRGRSEPQCTRARSSNVARIPPLLPLDYSRYMPFAKRPSIPKVSDTNVYEP